MFDAFREKKIVVFGRTDLTNYGDRVLAECCTYLIGKVAEDHRKKVEVSLYDLRSTDDEEKRNLIENSDAVVFPGGGLNGVKFNNELLALMDMVAEYKKPMYLNAVGIKKYNIDPVNDELLSKILNHPSLRQVTTRGELTKTLEYVQDRKTSRRVQWILDAGMWAGETYGIEKKKSAKKIGIGIIRPEIYKSNGNDFDEDYIFNMYIRIINELESRGYEWQLFSNGMKTDQAFGYKILEALGKPRKGYIAKLVTSGEELTKKISRYSGVIASRMHANIIASSMGIPTVGLVWNEKMIWFAQSIGVEDRYIQGEDLNNTKLIVDKLEQGLKEGFDNKFIDSQREKTYKTYRNIIKCK